MRGAVERCANSTRTVENVARASDSPDFGMLLRHYRVAAGLSQEALAERARMSSHGVSALERGYRRTPQRETLALLGDALGLSHEQRREFEAAAARWVLLRRGSEPSIMVGPWAERGSSNLPFALTSFVGREAELEAVAGIVRDHRLVTLTGAGGVGKTQTALHVGTALSGNDCVAWFVGLASIGDSSLVVPTIASTFGVQETPHRPLIETLSAYLKNKALLLILDNCEHVIGEAARVTELLLTSCPRLRILATSREPLRASGEQTYPLPPLKLDGAIALFLDRARAVQRGITLTDDTAPIVAEICRRLDGIPLAIELAAARVSVLSIPDLAQRLDERFRILIGGSRAGVSRQKTLSALIDWSYDLLTPREQRLFVCLGIFRGGFGLDAVAGVCGGELDKLDVLELLSSLTDKSLVVADTAAEHARYRLLESTTAYALEKLNALGEREVVARRHAEYFRDQVEASRELSATSFFAWLARIEPDLDNCRAVLEWALTQGNDVALGASMAAEARLWAHSGLTAEGRYWVELALRRVNHAAQPRIAATLRLALSNLSSGKRKHDEARAATLSYALAGDDSGVAKAQRQVAFGLFQMRRLDDAKEMTETALAASRQYGLATNAAQCLDMLGFIAFDQGDRKAARELHAESLAAFRALGDEANTAVVLGNLAELEFADGNPQQALRLATESLEITLRANNAMDIAMFYANSGAYRIALGDLEGAREAVFDGLRFARRAQSELNTAIGLQHLALLDVLGGDAERAAQMLGYVDAQFRQLGYEREGTEQWGYDTLLAKLHEALAEVEIANRGGEGARWSEEHAFEAAMKS